MGNRMVTWLITSRDPEMPRSWLQYAQGSISRKLLDMLLPTIAKSSMVGYPSDSLASCFTLQAVLLSPKIFKHPKIAYQKAKIWSKGFIFVLLFIYFFFISCFLFHLWRKKKEVADIRILSKNFSLTFCGPKTPPKTGKSNCTKSSMDCAKYYSKSR